MMAISIHHYYIPCGVRWPQECALKSFIQTHSRRKLQNLWSKAYLSQYNDIYAFGNLTNWFRCALGRTKVVWWLSLPKHTLVYIACTSMLEHSARKFCIRNNAIIIFTILCPHWGRVELWSWHDVTTVLPIHSPHVYYLWLYPDTFGYCLILRV